MVEISTLRKGGVPGKEGIGSEPWRKDQPQAERLRYRLHYTKTLQEGMRSHMSLVSSEIWGPTTSVKSGRETQDMQSSSFHTLEKIEWECVPKHRLYMTRVVLNALNPVTNNSSQAWQHTLGTVLCDSHIALDLIFPSSPSEVGRNSMTILRFGKMRLKNTK